MKCSPSHFSLPQRIQPVPRFTYTMTRGCFILAAYLLSVSCAPSGFLRWDGWFLRANQFDVLVETAVADLKSKNVAGFKPSATAQLAESVRRLNFAGLISLLAGQSFEDSSAPGFLETAASAMAKDLKDDSISESHAKTFLSRIFHEGIRPSEVEADPELRSKLLELGVKHLSKKAMGTYAKEEEIREIIENDRVRSCKQAAYA